MPSNLSQKSQLAAGPADNATQATQRPHKADPNSGLWVRAAKAVVYAGKRISDAAKVLFVIIRDYQGDNQYAWVSIETLAVDAEKTTRRVQQLVKELEAAGAIQVVERPGLVNHYRTCFLELKPEQAQALVARPHGSKANLLPISAGLISYPKTPASQATRAASTIKSKIKPLPASSHNAPQALQTEPGYQQLSFGWDETATPGTTSAKAATAKAKTAPLKKVSPLPLKEISPKLEPAKLEIIVCKNAPARDSNLRRSNGGRVRAGQPTSPKENLLPWKSAGPSGVAAAEIVPSQPELTTSQTEVCDLLRAEGLATQEAQKLAALSHNAIDHVRPWIEYARTRHNPAGYLRTVLLLADSRPPTATEPKATFGAGKPKNQSSPTANRQSGPIDFSKYEPGGKYGYLTAPPRILEVDDTATASPAAWSEEAGQGQAHAYEPPVPIVSKTIDPQVKMLIRQLDRTAYDNLRRAYVEDKTLCVGLYNVGHILKTDNWLPFFSHLGVTAIRLV